MTICEIDVFKNIPINGLSPKFINSIAEAATVCLDNQGHNSGVILKANGYLSGHIILSWTDEVTTQIRDTWNDLQEVTEYGATYIAVVIIQHFTPLKIIKRSQKGTGFDYWLGEKEDENYPFQEKARLEISGILKENKNGQFNSRVKEKLKQIEQSNNLKLPAYIVVVEFSTPKSEVAKK